MLAMNSVQNFSVIIKLLTVLVIANNSFSQCPLDLNENTAAPTDDLTLYFPFNGNLDNLGDPMYSASLFGAVYEPTICGEGLSFDGEDDYVLVTPTLNLPGDYTITAWINPVEQVEWMGIFATREQCATSYRGFSQAEFGLGIYDVPSLSCQVNETTNCVTGSGGDRYINPGIDIPDLVPTFVAVTVTNNDSEGRNVSLYVNCEAYDTEMTINFPTELCFDPGYEYLTTIGAESSIAGFTQTFNGMVDEFRLYESALTHMQILNVYNNCISPSITVESFPNCASDSAEITLYDSQLHVDYQLYDITNDVFIGAPQSGDCGTLVFNTALHTDLTNYEIVAVHSISGCTINMDSVFVLEPTEGELLDEIDLTICEGDSVMINGDFISEAGVYSDTVAFSPYCDSIYSVTISIFDGEDVDFSVTDSIGCFPITVNFTDETEIGSPIDSWDWDFGDGGSSTLENPSHEYLSPGPYNVTLTVTTEDGCVEDTTITILSPMPFYYYDTQDIDLCEGESVIIDGELIMTSGTYEDTIAIGPFCDSVITYNVEVYGGLMVDYDYSASTNCLPIIIDFLDLTTVLSGGESWLWDFGDGGTSSIQNPSYTYTEAGTYSVVLSVTNSIGCSYEITKMVTVSGSLQPEAAFSYTPPVVGTDQEVQFTDESINAESWVWTFGDGGGSTDQHPTYTYDEVGIYVVELIVFNGVCEDSTSQTIVVEEEILFFIPNAFTPDGDLFNERFTPVFTSGFDPYDYHLSIYNRWGELLFESFNAATGWNGTYGGRLVQDGVYIWKIEFGDINNDQRHNYNGHVTIIK